MNHFVLSIIFFFSTLFLGGFCPCCCGKKSTGVTGQTIKKQSCFCYLLTCGPCKAWTRYCLRLRYCIPCIQFCTPCLLGCNAVTLPCKRSETTAWCDCCAAPWNCICPCCQICCGVGCECCHITIWGLKDIPYVIESQPIFKPNVVKPVGSLDSIWFQDRVLSASINVPGAVSKNDRILLSSLAYELMANDGGLVRDNAFGPIQYFLIQKKVGYKEYFDTGKSVFKSLLPSLSIVCRVLIKCYFLSFFCRGYNQLREMQRHPVCLGKKSRKHQIFCK